MRACALALILATTCSCTGRGPVPDTDGGDDSGTEVGPACEGCLAGAPPRCPGALVGLTCPHAACVRLQGIFDVYDISFSLPYGMDHTRLGIGGRGGVPLLEYAWPQDLLHFVPRPLPRRGALPRLEGGIVIDAIPVSLGDLDGDGWEEIAFAGGGGFRVVSGARLSTGAGPDTSRPHDFGSQTVLLPAGDTDGDGLADFVVGTNLVTQLYRGDKARMWALAAEMTGGFRGSADTDGDGADDLVMRYGDEIRVFRRPSGTLAPTDADLTVTDVLVSGWTLSAVSPDLDGDGLPDLLGTGPGGVYAISLAGQGTRSFPADAFLTVDTRGLGPSPKIVGLDLDGDGFGDLLSDYWDWDGMPCDPGAECPTPEPRNVLYGPFAGTADLATPDLVLTTKESAAWGPNRSVLDTAGDMMEVYDVDGVHFLVACE